jgi:hypothetical protein
MGNDGGLTLETLTIQIRCSPSDLVFDAFPFPCPFLLPLSFLWRRKLSAYCEQTSVL